MRCPIVAHLALAGLTGWVAVGCSAAVTTAPPPAPAPPPSEPSYDLRATAGEGVRSSADRCEHGRTEACDALDDDCDGTIDEGCGYSGGELQVTISWNNGADVDLYVTDPSGETLYYNENSRTTSAGGQLDHDARGECRPEQEHTRIENAYWPSAPPGTYRIEVANFGPCAVDEVSTHVRVSVAVRHTVAGVYEYDLLPEQRVQVLEFSLE